MAARRFSHCGLPAWPSELEPPEAQCAYGCAYRLVSELLQVSVHFVAARNVASCRQFPFVALCATTFESACSGSTPPGATQKEAANAAFVAKAERLVECAQHRLAGFTEPAGLRQCYSLRVSTSA